MSAPPTMLRPSLLGDLQFPAIQFNFSPQEAANFLPPTPQNPQSFAYQNCEEQAGWRRRDRVMSYRKRRCSAVSSVTTCTPAKQRRTATKTHVSGTQTTPGDIPPVHSKAHIRPPASPFPGAGAQHQAPHDLMLNWQPFAPTYTCDIDMCNNEMQGLNILSQSAREPVILDIEISGYQPCHVSINVSDGELTVCGKRQAIQPEQIVQHKFTRVYTFPSHYDASRLIPDFSVPGLLRILCPCIENFSGMFEGEIQLEIMDSDKSIIKRNV